MPIAHSPISLPWSRPFGGPLLLSGLVSGGGEGDVGLTANAGSWAVGFNATSVSVTFTRTGGAGSAISLRVVDTLNTELAYFAPTVYPAGTTTVVLPLAVSTRDIGTFQISNSGYPASIDLTINDLFASRTGVSTFWTDYLGCREL